MNQICLPAFYMRGGTSKGLLFRGDDLPPTREARAPFLLGALGSPDPNQRQLNGMGGGISSLSKVLVVWRSTRDGIDVDYEVAQVAVDQPMIDYGGNCGNMSSAVGVFAVEAGLVDLADGEATLRMYNINTSKRVDCVLQVAGGRPRVEGDLAVAGVAGTGAPIRLDFMEPGGAGTGRLLPAGAPTVTLELPDGSHIEASIVDAANPCVFVRAADLGRTGAELPIELRGKLALMAQLEAIRAAGAVAAGMAPTAREATRNAPAVPKVAMVAPALDSPTLSGETLRAGDCDIQVRMLSMGLPHMAVPLTGAMCVAVAAQIEGTLVQEAARPARDGDPFRVGNGSGVLPVSARVGRRPEGWFAESVSVFRTARVLMQGQVYAQVPKSPGA